VISGRPTAAREKQAEGSRAALILEAVIFVSRPVVEQDVDFEVSDPFDMRPPQRLDELDRS
jgi:hypothetical protein